MWIKYIELTTVKDTGQGGDLDVCFHILSILMSVSIFCPSWCLFPYFVHLDVCFHILSISYKHKDLLTFEGNCGSILLVHSKMMYQNIQTSFFSRMIDEYYNGFWGLFSLENNTTTIDFFPFVASNRCLIERNECANELKSVDCLVVTCC